MKKYFLTGASGTLGTELQKHLNCWVPHRGNFDVRWPASELADEMYSEPHDWSEVSAIIHCAGYTDVPGAETHKKDAIEINIIGTKNIVNLARLYKKKVVYISTDYVYAGIGGGYREIDRPEPFNFYGFTKLAGEVFLNPDEDLIIRTSFKPSDLWNAKLDKAFVDIHTSADYVDIIAKEIAFAIEYDLKGVYNIGTEKKSVYDLAKRRNPNVGKISRFHINCRMPRDISMDISKFESFKKSQEKVNE